MIKELEQELLDLVRSVPAFSANGFSGFDTADIEKQAGATVNYPVAGVIYNGAAPVEGNRGVPVAKGATDIVFVDGTFIIVIGVEYGGVGAGDTKHSVFDLLDQVRSVVSGHKGINPRPWRWNGERPEAEASGDGVVFYSQVWQTVFVSQGTFNNPQ